MAFSAAMPAPSWAQSGIPLVIFLFFVVFFRAQATYWLARGVPALVTSASGRFNHLQGLANWANGPIPRKGASILERWGIIVIPLAFLTVGLQTAILGGAGLVRMNWAKFTAAMIPGCIAWAFLYGFGMLAVWTAAVKAAAGNPWAWVALAIIAAALAALVVFRRRRSAMTPAVMVVSD